MLLSFALAAAAHAAPPADFDARVEAVRKAAGVPGMAIAIVERGEVTLARGYGVKKLGLRDRVDADTIFPTGSTGKAFTVAALAILVDRGRIDWDDAVIEHMPWFRMYDPWVTREITIRDLLVHRSGLGLGAGDLMFVPRTNLTRRESVERLRYIKPATSFRSAYAYDNVLYMAAGQLIEEVAGKTWEDFVADEVLRPAGMLNSTTDDDDRFATANRAWPHARLNGAFRGLGDQEVLDERDVLGRNSAPAGGLAISANDMARWLLVQLAHGKLPDGDGRLFSAAASKQMWAPVVIMPIRHYSESLEPLVPNFSTYALGWDVQDYQGVKLIQHGGAVFGFLTMVVLIPEKDVGLFVVINSEEGEVVRGLAAELVDHYLGLPHTDWTERFAAWKRQRIAKGLAAYQEKSAEPADVGPSLALVRYAGDYADPWYGPISIRLVDGRLQIDFLQTPGMTGVLEHWQYDTFRTRWDDESIEPAYVTFALDADGKVERITMKAVSPFADFSYDYHDLEFSPAPSER
ncbi:MAG TPA: serine hydrolase [Woeseiaceae bacterium]|nr:serine hydrolase [Woeseiaceae bacterium]